MAKSNDLKFRKRSEITITKLDDGRRISCVIPKKDCEALRSEAYDNETTVSEILRSLVCQYLQKKDKKKKESN